MSAQKGHKAFCTVMDIFSRAACDILHSPLADSWQQLYRRHGWSVPEPCRRHRGDIWGTLLLGAMSWFTARPDKILQLIVT